MANVIGAWRPGGLVSPDAYAGARGGDDFAGRTGVPAAAGVDPRPARGLPVLRRSGPGHLRRQGQESAVPAELLFRRPRQPAQPHPVDGQHRREGRLDRGADRGRGAAAGVLLDQGVRPPVQHQVPRRQVLSLARRDAVRGVSAGHGRPRGQAQRHPLLRALLPCLGDPGDRRPAAAGVPDAVLPAGGVQEPQAARPALPARLYRQVFGAVRRPDRRGGAPSDR